MLYINADGAYNLTTLKLCRVSCQNIFLLGKIKPATYLTYQEDCKILICGHFLQFWASVQVSSLPPTPLQKKWNSNLVFTEILLPIWHFQNSLTEHKNFCGIFRFWVN